MASPTILHVDMDAFYASVEVRDDPTLAGRPVIVGGVGRRGVVASCSYEARAYGVRSAMPSTRARALCPQAVFLPGRFDRYQEVSAALHRIFHDVTPLVEGISLDEAFLDVAGSVRLFGPPETIAAEIRRRVAEELGLSCTVGVAPSKFLAKLASKEAKPSATLRGTQAGAGVLVIEPGKELAFLSPLPIEALWGVGPATSTRLRAIGLTTVGQLAKVPVATVERTLGAAQGRHLHQLARGVDERAVEPNREAKSVGHEETYAVDQHDRAALEIELLRLADAVGDRLRKGGMVGRTVSVKVRFSDFATISRARSAAHSFDSGRDVARLGASILAEIQLDAGVRLLGISVSNLTKRAVEARQLSLGFDADEVASDVLGQQDTVPPPTRSRPGGWEAASDAIDEVRRRFGAGSVGSAALVSSGRLRLKRQGDTQWGPAAIQERAAREPEPDSLP